MSQVLEHRLSKTPAQTAHLEYERKRTFPEAWTVEYKGLEASLTNQDKDRHVLAATIRSGSQAIVTFNLKHFPRNALEPYDIEAVHPDEFLINQFHLDDALVISKFTQQAFAIGRTPEEQLRAFHRLRTLPLFTQAIGEALAIDLA